MCGIVGLMLKNPALRSRLGELALPMFTCLAERGPDSGGIAVFGQPTDDRHRRISLFIPAANYDWRSFAARFAQAFDESDVRLDAKDNHATVTTRADPAAVAAWLAECDPSPIVLSVGRSLTLYKDMGNPFDIARRYNFRALQGTHLIGHTRMATESAVTPHHAHPFTAGEDFALVHNGSLSNPYMLRRMLERQGLKFQTDNDTEAACRFVEWRMRTGDTLDEALREALKKLDGFYTLLIATPGQMTILRDPFACKPAVAAETDDYVAVASEFRSLSHLPGIEQAKMFEPQPEEIYSWKL